MQVWDLETPIDGEASGPKVLVSTPQARVVLIGLTPGEEMGEHRVRERAFVQVLAGSVEVGVVGGTRLCKAGTLVVFEPGESHSLRALEEASVLLTLAPWPADDHYAPDEHEDPHELPVNATRLASL